MKRTFSRPLKTIALLMALLTIIIIHSCKKDSIETKPPPDNKEILFDYKDGDAVGFVTKTHWEKTNITWYVEKWCNSLSQGETRDLLQNAFKIWADVSSLTFTEVQNVNQADIVISFGENRHWTAVDNSWCPDNFEVVWKNYGVLAHTYYPPPNGPLAGDLHFCDLHKWSPYGQANNESVSLLSVAIHEIGHGIGIGHSEDATAMMYAYYSPQNIKYTLSQDDINAVQSIYKKNTSSKSTIRLTSNPPASVQVNQSQSFTVTINNDGEGVLQVTDININNNVSGAFSFLNGKPNLPAGIPSFGKLNVSISFSPASAIQYNSTLVVMSNASSGNNSLSLISSGTNPTPPPTDPRSGPPAVPPADIPPTNPPTADDNSFIDARDGRSYKTIKIGNQVWMAEDLNYSHSKSILNNGSRFYEFSALNAIAPSGWRVATDEDWQTLETFQGMSKQEANTDGLRGTDQGIKLAIGGSSGLNLGYKGFAVANSDGAISNTGIGQIGNYWTSTTNWIGDPVNNSVAKARSINIAIPGKIYRLNAGTVSNYYIVRCVKNL